ncbi:MAG: hypothetical protein FWG98_03605 [Candidatus Cloacimonetes bacterium]|nr:hypothetical protein [Candidatus Cloacimonadota bacterium]
MKRLGLFILPLVLLVVLGCSANPPQIANEESAIVDPISNRQAESFLTGRWISTPDLNSDLVLDIMQSGEDYTYRFQVKSHIYEGEVTVYHDGILLEGIPWVSNLGDTMGVDDPEEIPTYGIDFVFENGNLLMQNHGNAMNYYVKIDCDERFITLVKETTQANTQVEMSETIEIGKLQIRDEVYYFHDIPYSGVVLGASHIIPEYADQSSEIETYEMSEGLFHGKYELIAPGRDIRGNYRYGKKHGEWRFMEDYAENVANIRHEIWQDGIREGEWLHFTYYYSTDSQEHYKTEVWENGSLVGGWTLGDRFDDELDDHILVTEDDWEGMRYEITIQVDGQPQKKVTMEQYFEYLDKYHFIPTVIQECVFPNATFGDVYHIVNKRNLHYLQSDIPLTDFIFSYNYGSITVTYEYKSEKHLFIEMLWVHSGGGFIVEIIEMENETVSKLSMFAP